MAEEIVLIYEARIATVQILEQILSHIEETTGIGFRSRSVGELRREDLGPGTYPFFARTDSPGAYRLARSMRKLGIDYGYYLDDNFWELGEELAIGRYYGTPNVQRRIGAILDGADSILVATTALQDYLHEYGERVHQVDSFFDFSLIPVLPPAPPDRSVLRGGFAASAGRISDIAPIMPELLATLDARPDFEFEFIGAADSGLPAHPRIHWFPYLPDYQTYVRFQREREWDFAIAPLADTPSNRYKTDNKFREYAAQGVPGIYQNAAPYAAVRDGETGLLVGAGARTWRQAIERYLDEPELRTAIRVRAREDAERRVSIDAVCGMWLQHLAPAPGIGDRGDGLRRTLAVNRRQVPKLLKIPQTLIHAAVVSFEIDGFGSTIGRTLRFGWRKLRGVREPEHDVDSAPGRLDS